MPFEIDRAFYARLYSPTVGDRVRLVDTNVPVEGKPDEASPGDETLWGSGKTIRPTRACSRPACLLRSCVEGQRSEW